MKQYIILHVLVGLDKSRFVHMTGDTHTHTHTLTHTHTHTLTHTHTHTLRFVLLLHYIRLIASLHQGNYNSETEVISLL